MSTLHEGESPRWPHQKEANLATLICVGFCIAFTLIGLGLNSDKSVETLIPTAWIYLFVFDALTVLALGIFWSRRLLYITGLVVPITFVLRLWASLDRILSANVSPGRSLIAIGLYGGFTMTTIVIWARLFPPVLEFKEYERTKRGAG